MYPQEQRSLSGRQQIQLPLQCRLESKVHSRYTHQPSPALPTTSRKLTHKQHQPWPYLRKISQQRIPVPISTNVTLFSQRTYCLNLSRINLNNPDPCSN
jgi:hypothetical protein